jgi:2-polyprenyl-3-methyl-5-hydroxy-6-metoxy-1,4-benzoquinol methylase
MTSTTEARGSAERWGPRWGGRATDWAATEAQQLPTYEEAIARLGIGRGTLVLEVGCGSGVFLRAAAERGAQVSGLDASTELVELARAHVPEADMRVGDMQFLTRTTRSTSSRGSTRSSSRRTSSPRCARRAESRSPAGAC